MKIYLIERADWDYDEYDSHVIVANNETEVRDIATKKEYSDIKKEWGLAQVSIVCNYDGELTKPFILLSSYNAG